MLQIAQNLAIFFLTSQLLSGFLLAIGYQLDEESFEILSIVKWKTRPGLRKAARLFGQTEKPVPQIVFLLSLIFVLFSYVGLGLLIAQVGIFLLK